MGNLLPKKPLPAICLAACWQSLQCFFAVAQEAASVLLGWGMSFCLTGKACTDTASAAGWLLCPGRLEVCLYG